MNRLRTAQYIAMFATACSILAFGLGELLDSLEIFGFFLLIAVISGIVSYFFGGFGTALKMSWKIATWGLLIVPFPWCLLAFLPCLIFGVFMFILLPITPIRKAYQESMLL